MPEKKYTLSEVFVPRGIPTVTYINRAANPRLKAVRDVISTGGIINLFGDSKSGKTVACVNIAKDYLKTDRVAVINGRQTQAMPAFWDGLRVKFRLPTIRNPGRTDARKQASEGKTEGGLGWGRTGITSGTGSKHIVKEEEFEVETYPTTTHCILHEWTSNKWVVILDDFHHVPPSVRNEIIFQAKSATDLGGRLVVASIPPIALDEGDRASAEMDYRQSRCQAPLWDPDKEIKQIAVKGFAALNVRVPDIVIEELVRASYRSPMLMQQYCHNLCSEKEILETQDPPTELMDIDTKFARQIIGQTAKENAMPFSVYLRVDEPNELKTYTLRNRKSVNARVLALLAMASLNINNRVRFDRLHRRTQSLVTDPDKVRQSDVTAAVKAIVSEIRARKQRSMGYLAYTESGDSVIELAIEPELGHTDSHAFIAHPSLKLFLYWYLRSEYIDFDIVG